VKKQFELEYPFNTSPKVLYQRLSTSGGLSEWFADDVNQQGNIFTFIWDGAESQAELLQKKDLNFVRYRWLDEGDDDSYFEFRIQKHDLTGDVALIIVDFADEDEKDDAIELWDSQVAELKHVLGL
jgi:uncharacterized protein YndB with AHSA1/START domain